MKKYLVFLFACFLVSGVSAQDISKSQKIPTTYDRSSITFLYLEFPGDNHSGEVKIKIDSVKFADKFYNNNVGFKVLTAPFSRGDMGAKKAELIQKSLIDKKVPTDIISKWYSRTSDGLMSLQLVNERGMFNATDAAFLQAQTTKRGNAALEDYGNRLIDKSYILVLDYQSVQTMEEAKMDKTLKGWKSTVTGYLFKVDYNDEVQNKLYDIWIYDDDSPQVKADKKKKFEQMEFPLKFVTETTVYVTATQAAEGSQLGKFIKKKSMDQLLTEMVQKGYDESLYFLEKKYEDFRVKTPISQVRPIRAKIGKKEGIKCDYRFFAYEYVYDEKTNSSKQKFRGVIRATSSIVDNRHVATGSTGTTKFYQTAGRKLETGFLLQQRNDFGAEISIGAEVGEIGGIYGRADLRLGRFINFKSTFLYLEGGFQMADYPLADGIMFAHYGGGLAKGFMLMRNLELRPYLGVGQESATHDDWSDNGAYKALYAKVGGNLALNLKHNIQVVGGVGVYSFIGNAENDNGDTGSLWTDLFPDRTGASTFVGLRIGF